MSTSRNRNCILAGMAAAAVALGGAAPAAADGVAAHWRHVRVPAGILAGVPSGASPGGARLRTYYPPYPVGFAADPYFTPPAVVTVPPPIVFAPPPVVFGPPCLDDIAPLPYD